MDTPARPLDDEISLPNLVAILWAGRWLMLLITFLTTAVAGSAALVIQKQYQATIIISPTSSTSSSSQLGGLGALASQFSGVASLAGISVGGDSKKFESLAVLQSEALTESYIEKNDLLPILFAKKWDSQGRKWKEVDPKKIPTLWKANRYFKNNIRAVVTDGKTGLATMTITWKDPELAAKWANDLVRLTNESLRDKAIQESERNIAYLTEQASKTELLGAREAIFAILQAEINKVMLARGNSEFGLKVLDPAFAPESPSSPNLPVWSAIGLAGGLILSVFVIMLRNEWRNG